MCRWLAYSGQPVLLEDLIYKPAHSLVDQSLRAVEAKTPTNGDGFGIGWYGERPAPGLYREVLPAWNDANLRSLAHQIRSGLFFAHVRASTGTASTRFNCHPFAHGRWLFMHNGQVGGYAGLRRRLESLIPDAYYEHRLGTTDSEILFYLLLAAGLETDPVGALARCLRQVREVMAAAEVRQALRFTAALTDGRDVYALRYASDLAPPTLYWRSAERAVCIVSEPLDSGGKSWEPLPPNKVLVVGPDLKPCFAPLFPAAQAAE